MLFKFGALTVLKLSLLFSLLTTNTVAAGSVLEVGSEFKVSEGSVELNLKFLPDYPSYSLEGANGDIILAKSHPNSRKQFALFLVKCKRKLCLVNGEVHLLYPWGRPELVFIFHGMKESSDGKISSISYFNSKITRSEFKFAGYVTDEVSAESFTLRKNPKMLSSDRIKIDLYHMSENALVNYIENCYGICERVVVTGNFRPTGAGQLYIRAKNVSPE